MSFTDDFLKGLEKRNVKQSWTKEETDYSQYDDYTRDFLTSLEKRKKKKEEEEANLVEDIAPVRSDRGKADILGLDWFQKGALSELDLGKRFEDGYQFGDVLLTADDALKTTNKAILGTAGDVALEVAKGVGGLAEGVADLLSYGAAGVAGALGNEDASNILKLGAQLNVVDHYTKGADDWLEQYSVMGNTADSVMQGIGQVGTLILTGGLASTSAGATALTTGVMGASGVGSGISEAYEGGADDDEALTYGLISGAADAFTEFIFGGLGKSVKALGFSKGLSSADDMLAKAVSSKFKSTVAKNVAEFGIKAGAEGLEEVLAGTLQAIGKKATYMTEEDFGKILEDENLFEQFIVGAMTSGIMQGGGLVNANDTGRDFITGLTQNEQTVVDSLYESEIADKDLDKKEKQKIYDQILSKLDKGHISTDDIESALGGETYKAYRETADSEKALKDKLTASQKEYSELKSISWKERSQEQNNRIAELDTEIKNLEAQVKETTANSKLAELKSQLGNEVFNLTKSDTKLQESYREEMRRGQDLELDVEQYKGAAKITAQNLLKGGMNNTNRTHDVVNFLTKLSADKNIVFDVATAQKLADAGLAVDGKQVNGVITKDGIVLNLESSAVLETTVGHEITHALEGTEHYDVLKNAIKEYAELKGVYADKYSSLESIYSKKDAKGNILKDANGNTVWIRDDVDIDSEIVADLVGEYLFTDADFINNLSVKHRNVFQKIYDEIKYLVKIATAGSKEAQKLEEVKRAFDKAYREDAEVDTAEYADGEVKYSIREEAPPKETGIAYKVFFVKDGKLYPPMVANPDGADTPMGVWLNADVGQSAPPSKTGRQQVKAGGKGTQGGGGSLAFRPGWHLGDLPRASQFDRVNPETGKKELFPENFVWAEVEYAKDVDYQEEAMSYGYTDKGKFRHAYAGLPRLPENGYYRYRTNPKPDTVPWIITGAMKVNRLLSDAEVNEILEKNGVAPVHRQGGDVGLEKFGVEEGVKYSLTDSDGRQLSKEQSEYFKDSKVVDENGSLKVVYHGTRKADFTVFKRNVNFFTDSKEMADSYSPNGEMYEGYVNITKPYEIDAMGEKWSKIPIDDATKNFLQEYGASVFKEGGKWRTTPADIASAIEEAVDNGDMDYDGIIIRNIDDTGNYYKGNDKHLATDYITFKSNQFKNADNNAPTSDPDIRFSLSEAVEETKDLVAIHNLQSSELLRTINLGGLPMPSIAVIKAQQGHEQYGDVSLIFPKDTIDPKARKENKVYGGDAWTPTYPRIEYKPNKAVSKRIKDKYYELAEKIGYDAVRPLQIYTDELESALNRDGGEAGMLDRLYADTKMMQVYLEDSGKGKVEPIVKETRTEATEAEKEMNEWFIDRLGEDVIRAFKAPAGVSPFSHRQEFMAQYGDLADNAYRDLLVEKYDFSREEVEGVLDNTDRKDILRFIRNAEMYLRNGGVTVKTETDYDATEKAITAKAKDGYKEWVDNLFNGVEEKSGIRNNVDYFTNSGNRRSWDALHWENTLENVVKVMKAQDQTGADAFAPSSALFAVANKQYGSIADIKADSGRLGKVTEAEYEALKEEYSNRLAKIADSIKDPGERNPFIATDRAAEEIVDAVRTQKTKSGMLRYMQKWNNRVTESIVDDIVSLVSDIANMPTGYFEAKPQRAVGLDEVGVFVIPNNTDAKLKQELLGRGYSIAEYDPNVEGDRQRVVNSFEEYKFSLSDPNDIAPVDFRKSAKYLMLEKSNAQDIGDIAPMTEAEANALQSEKTERMAEVEPPVEEESKRVTRSELHKQIIGKIKHTFQASGLDFDEVLKTAKNLSTFATVDNTPQRVMEKALGYKEGKILSDLTVNKVAQNETEGIKWLNSVTGRKNGLLARLSEQYKIKPGSKESAAAQMYAEGFYVNDNNDIIAYGDAELAQDFPDAQVQRNIKGLARDQRIRQFYDETLEMINESRTRNAYPEIPRLDNYFLHFRAMDDTFSKLGLPFNPNDIRAKDLPTDLNGVTADLKPGQPYFASAMHRKGRRTSFDLLGGLERYASSAKNQIYHIDDIQTIRALRNYLADNFGQAHGLENIDTMTEEEAQQRIEEVFNSHLSTFAKFLNEEANVLAGKTALIDRGIEGIIGRRGITFLDTLNKQVGSNMIGWNVSSAMTNFDSVVRAFAKTNKYDFLKAFTQYTSNKIGSAFGKGDGFAESNPTLVRRRGADRFYRTPWQKAGDAGYALMGVVDNISTELIVRAKYNELTRNGMSEQQAVVETDKWVSRLMGDRSLGQQPLLFNSKMLGLVTKFQLEVRNNLDSMFYDTIQEAKASNEDIVNAKERNAKTAAKITSTLVQTAVATHLFGKAFEAVAGYNPSFDIVSVLATLFGFDDEEESEDTTLDNMEQAFLELLEDLPYTSTFTGGRIPIGSALPIEQLITGKDQYGNEKSRWETITETAPYYLLPGGYGQIKKTTQGLGMFSDDLPIAGSYTDSGNLRFPVEDTLLNRLQAGIFGQYASQNARDYFDNNRTALKEKQIQEFIDVDIPIRDYWEYREGLSEQKTIEDKFDYIAGLDLPVSKKNILINNIVDREEAVDLEGYEDFSDYEEFDFATKNPEKYTVAKAVGGYNSYASYYEAMNDITADKDENGKSITGSRKEKIIDYVNGLDIDYGMKIILFKSEYKADDTYNADILDYLNSRDDLTYDEIVTILTELDFTVDENGNVYWK